MFKRLQQKWNVDGTKVVPDPLCFAVTGSLTAFITKQVTTWMHLDSSSPWFWIMKLLVLIFGYQFVILIVAIPFGQFKFFWSYEKKLLRWFAKWLGMSNRNR